MERLLKLALLEVADNPNVLLDSEELGKRLGVSSRQARNYIRLLRKKNYFTVIRSKGIKEVILTRKAFKILEEYYRKLQKPCHIFKSI